MDIERTDWGLTEWKAHALALESALDSAMDGWGHTVQELEQSGKTLATLAGDNEKQTQLLTAALSLAEQHQVQRDKAATQKRGRGRPRKVIDDSWLLDEFSKMKAEFIAANGTKRPTDNAVLTWYFGEMFLRYGGRASKAKSPEFQAKLKRFRNRLGDARNPIRRIPI